MAVTELMQMLDTQPQRVVALRSAGRHAAPVTMRARLRRIAARPLYAAMLGIVAGAVLTTLAGCGADTPPLEPMADPQMCHDTALPMMRDALLRDGDLHSLPRLPDRSMGITACRGLTPSQLDSVAARLKVDLAPVLATVAARSAH
jgi:hypothetical protein